MKDFIKSFKQVIVNNLIIIFSLSLILGLELFELDYSVYSPGGLINIDNRLENAPYKASGSFNMTYVSYRKGSIMNLLIAKVLPTFDIIKNEDITLSNEDIYDMYKRDDIQLQSAISNATMIAYAKANKQANITAEYDYLYYIRPEANSELRIGDLIVGCDNNEISNYDEIHSCVQAHNAGEVVEFKVNRNNKVIKAKSTIGEDGLVGIIITRVYSYDLDPKVTYKYATKESGSSGGLMLALSLYNSLIEEDITKGLKIAGTGTIEPNGTVGEISGVKYKIKGAVKNKVDLFIVPEANYEEAKQVVEENNFNLKLLKASTFDQVLEDLKNFN